MGLMIIQAPASDDRVECPDDPCGGQRHLTLGYAPNSILEATERLLRGIRIQRTLPCPAGDLGRSEPHRLTAAFDLVSQECKPMPDVHDARLARIQLYAQFCQDLSRRCQGTLGLGSCPTGHHPIVTVPRELLAPASHLPIQGCQEHVTEQRAEPPTLRGPCGRRKLSPFDRAACFQSACNDPQHPSVGDLTGDQGHQLVVVDPVERAITLIPPSTTHRRRN